MKIIKHRSQIKQKEAGQGFVEYAMILFLVGIAAVLVISLMRPAIGDVFSRFVAQAPVAPPALLNYTPPPTFTSTPTIDPLASSTPVPSFTPIPTETLIPTETSIPTETPIPSDTPPPPPCDYGPHIATTNSTVRVEMEDFRCGGQGVSFSENGGSGGPGSGDYRTDYGSEGPDLETTSDTGDGFNLGWPRDGEWLEYAIEAPHTAAYNFIIR